MKDRRLCKSQNLSHLSIERSCLLEYAGNFTAYTAVSLRRQVGRYNDHQKSFLSLFLHLSPDYPTIVIFPQGVHRKGIGKNGSFHPEGGDQWKFRNNAMEREISHTKSNLKIEIFLISETPRSHGKIRRSQVWELEIYFS